jgi:DNA repair protein RadA/Sms
MVDSVITLEGDRSGSLRILRVAKNRYGSCEETSVLSMGAMGLEPVPDPSAVLLADRAAGAPGSVVFPTCDGSRAMLLEVQALVAPSQVARRVAIGVDPRRLSLLLGVLTQRAGARFDDRDVFLAVAGGLALKDPSADLAACLALCSAQQEAALDAATVAFGEVGLGGEIRRVPGTERRLNEARRLGFTRAIVPRGTPSIEGLEIREVARVSDALALVRPARVAA